MPSTISADLSEPTCSGPGRRRQPREDERHVAITPATQSTCRTQLDHFLGNIGATRPPYLTLTIQRQSTQEAQQTRGIHRLPQLANAARHAFTKHGFVLGGRPSRRGWPSGWPGGGGAAPMAAGSSPPYRSEDHRAPKSPPASVAAGTVTLISLKASRAVCPGSKSHAAPGPGTSRCA